MIPRYEPMLAVPWPAPFTDPDWLFEVKWDGVRALLYWDGHRVMLRSRRGRDLTPVYPELTSFAQPRPCVLDGEIVAFDTTGRPSFGALQKRMNLAGGRRVAEAARTTPATLMAFDLLYDGKEIIDQPLATRRGRLEALDLPSRVVRSDTVDGEGEALFRAAAGRGLEGVVGKRRDSPYRPGVRAPEWRKIPHLRVLRAVVGGFTSGERGRSTTFGALLLGLWDGDELRWVGSVGTGFTDAALSAIRSALDETRVAECPFRADPQLPEAIWVAPRLVARVEFKEWTAGGRLRAPSFKGFSPDPVEVATWAAEGPTGQTPAGR